ncbi:MAG: UDP-N-acetylmuramoyl-tripeptide--D-alanyl-D-alanine ligase [Clostridiales bacterium]
MIKFSEVVEAVHGIALSGSNKIKINRVSTDSRDIRLGDLFIPIKGKRFDGHKYIDEAFKKGAVAVLTDHDILVEENKITIKVDDTLKALGDLAKYYRKKFDLPIVAVTGSVGKTSTKEMVARVLNSKYNVLKTAGNFNNEIGLPLTLFNLKKEHSLAVIEMGMSDFGEIRRLSKITEPDIAVITNIGLAHVENLGSKQNILKAKMEVLDGLSSNGTVVLNGDDSLLKGMKNLLKYTTVFYGMEEGLEYQAFNIKTLGEKGSSFEITINSRDYKVFVPVPGIHNIYNALSAFVIAKELGLSPDNIIEEISNYSPEKMRMEILNIKNFKIINDVYNASPQSMEAAIDVLSAFNSSKRKIAVLGDMLELGKWSEKFHRELGEFILTKEVDSLITVGKDAKIIAQSASDSSNKEISIFSFINNDDAINFLKDYIREDDIILIKGSRGMHMEEIIECIKNF